MKIIIIIVLLSASNFVFSQTDKDNQFERKGFIIGAYIGSSVVNLSTTNQSNQTDFGFSFNWKIGAMVSERMSLLLVGGASSIYDYNGIGRVRKRGFEGLFLASQFWTSDKLWIMGGIGATADAPVFSDLEVDNEGEKNYYWGPGVILGTGYELWRKKKFALDIQSKLHFGYANVPEGRKKGLAINIGIGINWY